MSERIQALRGMHDILPEDYSYFNLIKKIVHHRARQAGFRRIATPILEKKNLFVRSVGEQTDIITKELYTLQTKKNGPELALKPEGTAGIARAYLEHGLHSIPQPVELYYVEPHFRHDRPQQGRTRQFHQFGFEILGEKDPGLDVQIIQLADLIHQDLKIAPYLSLQINNIGCLDCRSQYIQSLQDYYVGKERNLCSDCKIRLTKNPLRLLDCKSEDCQILVVSAPKLKNEICPECHTYHEKVLTLLSAAKIKNTENPNLVRGLDYYNQTVFEFWSEKQGSQNAVGGGGHYDNLVAELGGPETPACGYSGGLERLIALMKEQNLIVADKNYIDVFVVQLSFAAKKIALGLLKDLRNQGVHAFGALGKTSVKNQLAKANKFKARFALILGEIEAQTGQVILRDMQSGSQCTISLNQVVAEIVKKIGTKNLDLYDPSAELQKENTERPEDELLIRD